MEKKSRQRWREAVINGDPAASGLGGQRGTGECFSSGELMCRADANGQVEGLFSDAVRVEMRNNEVNTVSSTSLHTAVVIKGTGGN